MDIYIWLIVFVFVIAFIAKSTIKEKQKQEKFILFFGLLAMFCLCALRASSVGVDTPGYKREYLNSVNHPWFDFDYIYFESGYIFLMKLCAELGLSFNAFLAVVYAIVFIPLYYFLKRFSKDSMLSLLIYICFTFFTFNLTGIRNSMAFSICLLAYLVMEKKKLSSLITSILFVLLASLFHRSAVVFFVALIIIYMPFEKKTALIYILVSVVLILSPQILNNFIADNFDGDLSVSTVTLSGSTVFYFLIFCLAIFLLYYKRLSLKECDTFKIKALKKKSQDEIDLVRFVHFSYFSILAFFLVGNSSVLIRAAMYYQIFIIVLLPSLIHMFNKRSRIWIKALLMIFLLAFYYFTVLEVNTYSIVPYRFFWQ